MPVECQSACSVTCCLHTRLYINRPNLQQNQPMPINKKMPKIGRLTSNYNISNRFVFTDGELHSSSSLSGGKELIVEAELTGGEGEVSWQHAQLFRQSLKDMEKVIFEILVEMEES